MEAEYISKALIAAGVSCDMEQAQKLSLLMNLTLEKSKVMNLTAIKDENEFLNKMIIDSLLIMRYMTIKNAQVLDVGSGAGFPALPLAIMLKDNKFTLVEVTRKKANHLQEVINTLELHNVEVVCLRAEDFVKEHREEFDVVTARAVAELRVLLELTVPALKVGGYLATYKGSSVMEEISMARQAIKTLDLTITCNASYILPGSDVPRYYVILCKNSKTPIQYPRKYSIIIRKPL